MIFKFQDIPLTAQQMLLRGTRLKHTEWVIGLVINTGTGPFIECIDSVDVRTRFKHLD
jgi:magnesium-transporting ATPase (P-type)